MKEEVIKNVIEQVIVMLDNNVLADNGLESFEGWCENGDIFETDIEEHIAVMKRIAPAIDDLTNIILELQEESKNNEDYCVYIVNDSYLEDCFNDDDIDAFTETVNDDDFINYDCEKFETEKEATKFVEGLFYGCDERSPSGKVVLCSWNDCDKPFINALLNA